MFRLRMFTAMIAAAFLFAPGIATDASAASTKLRIESHSHEPVTATTPAWLQFNIHGNIGTYDEPECHIEAGGTFMHNESSKVVFQGTEKFVDTECTGASLVGSPGKITMEFSSGLLTLSHMKIVLDAEGCVYELATKLNIARALRETEARKAVEITTKLNAKLSQPTEERECPIPAAHAGEEGPVVHLDHVGVSAEEEPFPANAFVISSSSSNAARRR
jgi:hypothetical protein